MNKNHGFTLIEVLVAMAIFAVSAMAVLNATGQNINTLGALEQKTLASMVADNQLALMMANNTLPSSEKSGRTKMAEREWNWTIKLVDTAAGSLKAVDVTVWQDDRKRNPLIIVRTYVPTKN